MAEPKPLNVLLVTLDSCVRDQISKELKDQGKLVITTIPADKVLEMVRSRESDKPLNFQECEVGPSKTTLEVCEYLRHYVKKSDTVYLCQR